jgi:outer membrane biosynthesis protein TonB
MRVRISFDALRLCLLVAAGVTSGYLWRAAFEASSPAEQRAAGAPRIITPAPAPPTVRIVSHHLTAPARRVGGPRVVRRTVVVAAPRESTSLVSRPVRNTPTPVETPAAPPPPKPAPAPAPQPTPTTSPPQPQPQSPPPVVAAPVQQVAAQPTPTTPTTPPSQSQADDGSRPGWGNGDKNHDHSGPGGKGK